MIYLDGNPLTSIGNSVITDVPRHNPDIIGSLYTKECYKALNNQAITSTYRSPYMWRVFDLLCYRPSGNAASATNKAQPGGFEIEMTFKTTDVSHVQCVCGLLGGTSSTTAGVGIFIGKDTGRIGYRAGRTPTNNKYTGESVLNRKVTARLIVLPTTSETYTHAYSGQIIVTDVNTGTKLADETTVFGESLAKDMMVTNQTNFYRFLLGLFFQPNNYTPLSVAYGTNSFIGYFYGGKIYVNPTGADTTIPTRIPIHVFTPVQKGQIFAGSGVFNWNGLTPLTINADGVAIETIKMAAQSGDDCFDNGVYTSLGLRKTLPTGTNFASTSELEYID